MKDGCDLITDYTTIIPGSHYYVNSKCGMTLFTFVEQNAIFLINMIDVMNITCSIPGIRKDKDWESHTINWKRVSNPCLSKMTMTIVMI